jgi:hypothetical protein
MVREGDHPSESKLLLEGFAGRYKILRDGKRRISAIHKLAPQGTVAFKRQGNAAVPLG